MKIVLGITTYNRLFYLKKLIESFSKTYNSQYSWRIIISDDGSDDGTVHYIKGLKNFENTEIITLYNNRVGVHESTNRIFKEALKDEFDYGFKMDDDLVFKKSGWEDLYINAIKKSGFQHLCYYNTNWTPASIEPVYNQGLGLQALTHVFEAQGCFFTFTKEILENVGFFDVNSFGKRGHGHIDFSIRCCNKGYNKSYWFWDVLDSNEFLNFSEASYYCSSTSKNVIERILRVEQKERQYVLLNEKRNYL